MTGQADATPDPACTAGTLLGGRVTYHQFRHGYRTGLEPVLLAAAVPAKPGDRVLEAGTGAGAGLLCLAARVPGIVGLGLELDAALGQLASENFARNGFDGLMVAVADVTLWRAEMLFDHAFANPPWHDPASTPSPVAGRRLAKQGYDGLLAGWAGALGAALRSGGTLSLILPASAVAQGFAALQAEGFGALDLTPLWPHAGKAARLIILRGVRHAAGAASVSPGLAIHHASGGFTDEADAVLRHGHRLLPD